MPRNVRREIVQSGDPYVGVKCYEGCGVDPR
jgi:hypothetical protein